LYVDSTDALLRGGLNQAVELLKENNSEMLVFSTNFDVYPSTPELEKWVKSIAEKMATNKMKKSISTLVFMLQRNVY
jgi:DNA repair photolyase